MGEPGLRILYLRGIPECRQGAGEGVAKVRGYCHSPSWRVTIRGPGKDRLFSNLLLSRVNNIAEHVRCFIKNNIRKIPVIIT